MILHISSPYPSSVCFFDASNNNLSKGFHHKIIYTKLRRRQNKGRFESESGLLAVYFLFKLYNNKELII